MNRATAKNKHTQSKAAATVRLPQTGGCQCAKSRYEITERPRAIYTCHCSACQRLTGSAFSMAVLVPDDAFHLTGVELRPIQRTADSGPW
jgi:hypothetical protein